MGLGSMSVRPTPSMQSTASLTREMRAGWKDEHRLKMTTGSPSVFTVSAGAAFADVLAKGLLVRAGDDPWRWRQ